MRLQDLKKEQSKQDLITQAEKARKNHALVFERRSDFQGRGGKRSFDGLYLRASRAMRRHLDFGLLGLGYG